MEKIIQTNGYGRIDVYEPVTEVPFGYSVWAIGRHNFKYERCVPLAKEGKEKYHVDISKLKYIMVDSEELALRLLDEAVLHGCDRDRFYEIVNA
jgi:hypothetical protein